MKIQWEFSTGGTVIDQEPFSFVTAQQPRANSLAIDSSEPFLPTNLPTIGTYTILKPSTKAFVVQAAHAVQYANMEKLFNDLRGAYQYNVTSA